MNPNETVLNVSNSDKRFRKTRRYDNRHRMLGGNPNKHRNESALIIPKPLEPKIVEPPKRPFVYGYYRCKYCKFEVEGGDAEHQLMEHLKNHGANN